MRRAIAVLVLSGCALGAQPASAVVGGQAAAPGEFPYVANIEIAGAAGCTGSLVAPTWVVTAGHCVTAGGALNVGSQATLPPSSFTVRLGTNKSDGSADSTRAAEERSVASVHVDPNYAASNGTGSDVGLLELAEPSKVAPVKIAAPGEAAIWEPRDALTIAGFGVTEEDGEAPAILQEAMVPRVSDPDCSEAYSDTTPVLGNAFDPATALCAGLPEGGKDTCQGDSGGPILGPLPGGGFRLIGSTSYGEGCAREGRPGVYGRLAEGSVKAFVSSLVPEAYASGSAPSAGATCENLKIVFVARGRNVRRVTATVDGRRVARRRGPGRLRVREAIPSGAVKVSFVVKRKNGTRRVVTRSYADCKRT